MTGFLPCVSHGALRKGNPDGSHLPVPRELVQHQDIVGVFIKAHLWAGDGWSLASVLLYDMYYMTQV